MTDAKKPTARKPVAKATAKATARKPRAARAIKPMAPQMKELAAAVLGFATERAMASDELGVKATNSRELAGRRQGMVLAIRLDDGTRIAVTIAIR